MNERQHFPSPWTAEQLAESFVVRDANGQSLAYVYFAEAERAMTTRRLEEDDARRIAHAIARLPDIIKR